jgi:hypothetical protein
MPQNSATSSLGKLSMKEKEHEEEAGLHFRGTAIVFRKRISGKLSYAVSGTAPGIDQGL